MARVTVEDCLKKIDSRFSLVHLAVRRVLQLRSGAKPLVNAPKNKEIVVALREIAAGKVTIENIRQLEEQQLLSDMVTPAAEDVQSRKDLMEVLQSETQYESSLEYKPDEAVPNSDENPV